MANQIWLVVCGGANRLNVYQFGQSSSTTPVSQSSTAATTSQSPTTAPSGQNSTTVPTSKWTDMGCITDSVVARTLAVPGNVLGGPANMTHENCQNACQAAGYTLAGMEYANGKSDVDLFQPQANNY